MTSSPSVAATGAPAHPYPLVALGAVLAGVVVTVSGLSGEYLLGVAALLLTGLVVAAGWPRLVRSPSPLGARGVLTLTTLALAAALWARPEPPRLQHVPIAVAVGVVLMCLHPLVQEEARARLVELLAGSSLGILVIVSGAVLVATYPVDRVVTTVAVVSVAAASLVDLLLERPGTAAWMLPAAMLVGGAVGVATHVALGGDPAAWPALVGLIAAAVALCLRRVLSPQPALGTVPGALAAGVASMLLVGPVVHVLARLPIS